MICPNCGSTNNENSNFCLKCGFAFNNKETNTPPLEMFLKPEPSGENQSLNSQNEKNNNYELDNNIRLNQQTNTQINNISQQFNYVQDNNETQLNQQVNVQINNNNQSNYNENNNKKNNIKTFIIIFIVIVIIVAVAILFFGKKKSLSDNSEDVFSSKSFFIQNKDGRSALFNEEGKKLTDFIFDDTYDFVNNLAVVKKDDQYGIIKSNGKMLVDFGKYKYIIDESVFFKVTDKNGDDFLIDKSGKVLYDMQNMNIDTEEQTSDLFEKYSYAILADEKKKTYNLLNAEGKIIFTFSMSNNKNKLPKYDYSHGYISIFYNDKNYIFDYIKEKIVLSFDSKIRFFVSDNTSKDKKSIILYSITEYLGDPNNYKLIRNGNLYDFSDKCDTIHYYNNDLTCIKNIPGYSTKEIYILDSNFNKGIDLYNKSYVDNNNYAMEDANGNNKVSFYKNGKYIKSLDNRWLIEESFINSGTYLLGEDYDCKNYKCKHKYSYYDLDGNLLFNKSFITAEIFDENKNAIVSEEKEKYYLINIEGKKISEYYTKINKCNKYNCYNVKSNNLAGLLDESGNVLIEPLYNNIDIWSKNGKEFAILKTADDKYVLYNVESKKTIFTSNNNMNLEDNYIFVENNDNRQYFTFSGKMFYES